MQAMRLMRGAASLGFRFAKKEREKTIRHLSWAFENKVPDEIEKMAKSVFLHFAMAAVDAIRMPLILKEGINNYVSCDRQDILDRHLNENRGAIILTGHIGNWEMLGAWMANNGYPLKVVGTSAYDPRLDEMIVGGRNMAGYTNIARGKGTREIIRHLRDKGFLGILIDQDTKVEGVFVNFFNRPAHTAVGPVVLSQKTGVPIVPAFVYMTPDYKYKIDVAEPLQLVEMDDKDKEMIRNTQICSDEYQRIISRYPTQWVWMHERWKKQPKDV